MLLRERPSPAQAPGREGQDAFRGCCAVQCVNEFQTRIAETRQGSGEFRVTGTFRFEGLTQEEAERRLKRFREYLSLFLRDFEKRLKGV